MKNLKKEGQKNQNKDRNTKIDKKKCKYCILLNIKSKSFANFFIGNLKGYYEGIKSSSLADLYNHKDDFNIADNESGLLITIQHSLTQKNNGRKRILLSLPLLTLTKDTGFFRDNTMIHCAKPHEMGPDSSISKGENETIISAFLPEMEADPNYFDYLNQNFANYFYKLDKKFEMKELLTEKLIVKWSPESFIRAFDGQPFQFHPRKIGEFDEKQMYVLFVRRKYLRRSLLRKLDYHHKRKQFQDLTALWIKEIKVAFNSIESFRMIANVS